MTTADWPPGLGEEISHERVAAALARFEDEIRRAVQKATESLEVHKRGEITTHLFTAKTITGPGVKHRSELDEGIFIGYVSCVVRHRETAYFRKMTWNVHLTMNWAGHVSLYAMSPEQSFARFDDEVPAEDALETDWPPAEGEAIGLGRAKAALERFDEAISQAYRDEVDQLRRRYSQARYKAGYRFSPQRIASVVREPFSYGVRVEFGLYDPNSRGGAGEGNYITIWVELEWSGNVMSYQER